MSNFDTPDLVELNSLAGGSGVSTDQVLYNLARRRAEYELLPWCRAHGVPVMAYSPIEQGRLVRHPALVEIADRHGATPAQIALAWVLRAEDILAIPRAATREHVRENAAARELRLTLTDLVALDAAFPPPRDKAPLEVL